MKKLLSNFVLMICMIYSVQVVSAQNGATITTNPTPAVICAGSGTNIQLQAAKTPGSGIVSTYLWSSGETSSTITKSPTITTTYTVTITFATLTPSTATATATITVNAAPVPVVTTASPAICNGDSTLLTSTITGQWYKNGIIIPGAIGTTYYVSDNSSYTIFVTSGGCSGESAGTVVTINSLPDAGFTPNSILDECPNSITPFVANLTGPNYTYQWYRSVNTMNGSNPGIAIPGATSPAYIPDMPIGTYDYSLKIRNTTTGCYSKW